MKFEPKALLLFAAFVAALVLALNVRRGTISPRLAIAGAIAFVVIEMLVFLGPLSGGSRGRSDR